jgi:hypothetical protein
MDVNRHPHPIRNFGSQNAHLFTLLRIATEGVIHASLFHGKACNSLLPKAVRCERFANHFIRARLQQV